MFKRLSLFIKEITNLDGHIDTDTAERSIRNNIEFKGPNAWILAVAIIIASVGLNVNSIPVIIGAMLISPLMGPIFGLGLGLGINDINLMKQAGKNLLVMVCISLAVSFLYFLITPLSLSNPTELLARTRPTIFDVLIALFGGFAGIFEQCRKEKGTVFAGVAIATALMPPLCTAGFSLATGNFSSFLGAIYLFSINCLFITLATYFLVRYFGFKKAEYSDANFGLKTQRLTTILIILFLVPSVWSAVILVKQNNFDKHAAEFVETHRSIGNSVIYDYKIEHEDGSVLKVFMTGETLSASDKNNLYAYAKEYGIREEQIIIREYSTQNGAKESDTVFKGIYERLGSKIDKHEQTIEELRFQLEQAKKDELPYIQLANEISATYPEVKHVYIAQGAHIALDSLTSTPCVMVEVKTDSCMSSESFSQLKRWVQVRLQIENIEVMNTIIE
ncbi:MAG: TIGR00341 family protein [Bacteroidales bacterium]|nr:TIGR00341 family protein [Bacteroidales bacterium]